MTFILGNQSGLAPVTPVAPGVVIPPAVERQVIERITIVSRAGSFDVVGDGPFALQLEATMGLTGPDTDVELDDTAGMDGALLRGASEDRAGLNLRPLNVVLSLLGSGDDGVEVEGQIAELRRVLASRLHGPAEIRVVRGDGAVRTLRVVHVPKAGDFDATWGVDHPSRRVLLRLLAPDPLWRGAPGFAGPWVVGGVPGMALPFALPFGLTRSSLIGTANDVVVAGDEITYPSVRVTGPSSSVQVTRAGVGPVQPDVSWTLSRALLAGQVATANHDPMAEFGLGQVVGPDGSDWSRFLTTGSDLFGLLPGVTSLTTVVEGSGPTTEVAPTWETRYWSCLG